VPLRAAARSFANDGDHLLGIGSQLTPHDVFGDREREQAQLLLDFAVQLLERFRQEFENRVESSYTSLQLRNLCLHG
jgi:hypothetical protein